MNRPMKDVIYSLIYTSWVPVIANDLHQNLFVKYGRFKSYEIMDAVKEAANLRYEVEESQSAADEKRLDRATKKVSKLLGFNFLAEVSQHKKDIIKARKEYEKEMDRRAVEREREEGEVYHFGNAKITKYGTKEMKLSELKKLIMPDTLLKLAT